MPPKVPQTILLLAHTHPCIENGVRFGVSGSAAASLTHRRPRHYHHRHRGRRLEEEFGIDLSDRKAFIRDQIDLCLETRHETLGREDDVQEPIEDNVKPEEKEEGPEEEEEEAEGDARTKKQSCYILSSTPDKVDKEVKKRGSGFSKPCSLSPQLQKLVGVPELARTEVVKKLWAYIREKDLQNPKNRKRILCDETLRALFCVDSIDMFQMNKKLSNHIWPIEEEVDAKQHFSIKIIVYRKFKLWIELRVLLPGIAAPVKSSEKETGNQIDREEGLALDDYTGADDLKQKEKRRKGGGGGFLTSLRLSDALVEFLGTGENELSRAEVVKRMWDYIKQNDLQDPSDKRRIICDNKLKELFEVDTFIGFSVSKLLTAHITKKE
ncbi:hypothetical protein RJ639_043738 [Escallonia herrerae]|uniref:DM2 domain-containing protein n=1 Tax=Escallonia herrerae TaxID=1293975 RepID=A0AA88WBF7_9ASTE|nr:hypothetical protein RJ639_043738 [Escallonia herrerae]